METSVEQLKKPAAHLKSLAQRRDLNEKASDMYLNLVPSNYYLIPT